MFLIKIENVKKIWILDLLKAFDSINQADDCIRTCTTHIRIKLFFLNIRN